MAPQADAGSHNQHPYRRGVRLAEALDPVLQRRCRRAEVHDQDLVLDGVDLATQPGAELGQLALVQVAEEDAVLHVIALALEGLEDGVAAAVVGDVVRDKIVSAGHGVTPLLNGWSRRCRPARPRATTARTGAPAAGSPAAMSTGSRTPGAPPVG